MARLTLINGAPGSGKSTLAHLLAQDEPLTLALDIDVIKHSLGQWDLDMNGAGQAARRLAVAMVVEQLSSGSDVIVGQFLARPEFIEQLEALASGHNADFVEVVLSVDQPGLRSRLEQRAVSPQRSEHLVNAALVTPSDVPVLVQTMEDLVELRPSAVVIDANGSLTSTLQLIRKSLTARR